MIRKTKEDVEDIMTQGLSRDTLVTRVYVHNYGTIT